MIGQAALKHLFVFSTMLGALAFFSGRARGDLQIIGYEDRLHDPYYVGSDKNFIGNLIGTSNNWSGYGRWQDPTGSGGNWKHVAMISDNYFITANHNRPNRANDPAGETPKVRFYRTTDPNGEYWESPIAVEGTAYDGTQIGSSDLWVGKLASTPPSWVTRYPLAKRHEATNYLSYTDNSILIFGQDSPRSFTSVRVGLDEIDQVNAYGSYQWDYDSSGQARSGVETQNGDSGGPSFFIDGPIPVLAGIHTRTNYDTAVSWNLQQIMDAVDEPISVSTGLPGDVDGDFLVSPLDLTYLLDGYGKAFNASSRNGDLTGDHVINMLDINLFLDNYGKMLYAPTDFDRDGDVDGSDLSTIADNWLKSVSTPFTMGDANGDSFVSYADAQLFDRNQFRAYFGALPAPLSPIPGDLTGNGIVDGFDLNVVTLNLNKSVEPGTNGDLDGNGFVDGLDVSQMSSRLGDSFGDISRDQKTGPADFAIIANHWNQSVTGGRLNGDLTGDGWVDSFDARALFDWWGQSGGTFPGMVVPEPTAAGLFVIGSLLAACSSRRRPTIYFSRAMLRKSS